MTAGPHGGEYAHAPLPEHMTVPGWRVALIVCSFLVALPGFLYGAQAGLALGFTQAMLAALIGGALLCAGACLTSVVSVRTRLTTYLLIQRSFGRRGAAAVNVLIAVVHYCWFGVNVSFLGDAMVAAAGEGYGVKGDFSLFVIIGSALITLSTIYGFRTLDRLAIVAVPLLTAVLVAVCVSAIRQKGVVLQPVSAPPVEMSFGIAVSALIGNNMLTVAAMPDLARFIRTAREAVLGMALSFPVATPLLVGISSLIALATGQTDIMALIVAFGFGAAALFLLILSIWTINALNLYSAGLSLTATFPNVPQWVFIVLGGAIGMGFALMGIINAFIPFLLFLGLIIPPIAAIYVIDAMLVFREVEAAQSIFRLPAYRWQAIGTWAASVAAALLAAWAGLTLTTVPALDATIIATLVYLSLLASRARRERTQPQGIPSEEEMTDA